MYLFFPRGARYSFLTLVSVSALLCGCSSKKAPVPVKLGSQALDLQSCKPLSRSGGESLIYGCDAAHGRLFMTSLKDCTTPEKFTFQATTRQLLVGFVGLRVLSQESVTLGEEKALQTVARGTLDAAPVVLSTLTFRKNGCVHDMIFWREVASGESDDEVQAPISGESRKVAESVANETIGTKELSRAER